MPKIQPAPIFLPYADTHRFSWSAFQLSRLAERQVDALVAHYRVMAFLERQYAVVAQSGGSAPDNHVAVRQFDADCFIGSVQAAKQKDGWDSERYRDDGLVKVLLVFVLMQR